MGDVTRCPVCGEECYAPGVAQAILDATRTLRAENERLRDIVESAAGECEYWSDPCVRDGDPEDMCLRCAATVALEATNGPQEVEP